MKPRMTRRRFLAGLVSAPVVAGLYAWQVEPRWVEWVRRPLPVRNLPPTLIGKTLVQLSDIHAGRDVPAGYLRRVFATVQAEAPAIVVFTGDFITGAGQEALPQLDAVMDAWPRGHLGSAAVLGNHDYGPGWAEPRMAEQVAALLATAGCRVLRNEMLEIAGLKVIGLDDLWAARFRPQAVLPRLQPEDAAVVLSHNPDTCDLPGWENYHGWILSGHTHGGQCKPPFLPPPLLPVKNRRYTAGGFALSGGRRLYINRGVGNLHGVRFNVRPEVTFFELTRPDVCS